MKSKAVFVIAWCVWQSALALSQAPPQQQPAITPERLPRAVTVTAIPGVIAAGATWQLAWQGLDNADSPLAAPDGGLLFAQEQPNTIRKLDEKDYDSAFVKNTEGTGSIAFDYHGRIIAVQKTCTDPGRGVPCTVPPKIGIVFPESERRVIVDRVLGKPMTRPSDALVDKKDTVYFTDSVAYYIKPGGQAMAIGTNLRAGGIMLSPDETTLYIASGQTIVAFTIQPDGTVNNQREFGKLASGNGNSMAVDAAGRLYVASGASGVQVLSPEGQYLGAIPTPRNIVAVAFAGRDKKTLYVVGSGALAPNGRDFALAEGFRNNAKTIYKISMLAQGYLGRAK